MQVFALWHGGNSYSGPEFPRDLEMFNSVEEAVQACNDRMDSGNWKPQLFDYLNRDSEQVVTPGVDVFSVMHIYRSDPTDSTDPYPDVLVEFMESTDQFEVI